MRSGFGPGAFSAHSIANLFVCLSFNADPLAERFEELSVAGI
jgi:hypothetical protein